MADLIRTYSEMTSLKSWQERLEYLQLFDDNVDSPRFMNQSFYKSRAWLEFKKAMHRRDLGCDLGVLGAYIYDKMILHHINPVTVNDLENYNVSVLLNPENVITVSIKTHNTIHYLKEKPIPVVYNRKPGDTKLW